MRYNCLQLPILFLLWGKSIAQKPAQIVVIYYSQTGNTAAMAEAVAEGARSVDGANVNVL